MCEKNLILLLQGEEWKGLKGKMKQGDGLGYSVSN